MIDSHCHLADKKFDADRAAVIDRAFGAGVSAMICIADSIMESKQCMEIAQNNENVFCTVGVHPHCAKEWSAESGVWISSVVPSFEKIVAIGELGLDYHYDFSPRDMQRTAFREQLQLARTLKKPAVVHCREAIGDIRAILEEIPSKIVLHCCTEKWEDVEPLVKAGQFLSFTGIATFPQSEEIRRTMKQCPIEQMMIETDSPYLAPIPHRGKRNEPAYVVEVAKCVAEVKELSLANVDRMTTENAKRFFGLQDS